MRKATNPNDILCPLCLDILTVPRALPCLHTYCEKCLGDYIRNSVKNDGGAHSFKCPTCEKETFPSTSDVSFDKWAEQFPYDRILLSMLPEGKNKVDQLCEQCVLEGKKEPANSFCTNCREALCKYCVGIHISAKQKHTFINISDPSCRRDMAIGIAVAVKCSRHIHKDVDYLCRTHKQICCSECLFDDHGNCKEKLKLKNDNQALLNSKNTDNMTRNINQLAGYLDKCIEMNMSVVAKIEHETERMVDEIDNLISLLQNTKSQIIKEREELLETKSRSLHENTVHYRSLKASLINSLKSYEEVCKYGDNYECFVILHKLEDQIMQCEKILQTKYSEVKHVNSTFQLASRLDALRKMDPNQLAKVNVTETIQAAPPVPLIVRSSTQRLGRQQKRKFRQQLLQFFVPKADQTSVKDIKPVMEDAMSRCDDSKESKPAQADGPKPVMDDFSRETNDVWEIPRNSLKFVAKLSDGKFSQVWKGKWNKKKDVAIKTVKPGTISPNDLLHEAMIMKQCRHDKLVRLYAVCSREEPICIVTEFMSKGSLLSYVRTGEGRNISLVIMVDMAAQIASGMNYMEQHKLIHRDLAARNILVGENNIAKVADFSLAQLTEDGGYNANDDDKFAIKWTAPDAAYLHRFTIKSDVWSYGILLMEIVTKGVVPYPGMDARQALDQADCGYRMPKPSNCPDAMYEIMLKCWDKIAENRPTFEFLFGFFDDYFIATESDYKDLDES